MRMEKLNVLITNSMPFLGGAELWGWKLGRGLLARGHEVTFAVRSQSALAQLLRRKKFAAHEFPMRGDAEPYSLLSMVRLTRALEIDIILSTCERDFRLAGLATKLGGQGSVIPRLRSVWPHRSVAAVSEGCRGRWSKTLRFHRQRFNYNFFASKIITNSAGGKRDLVEGGWAKDDSVEVVYNGVDLSIFDPAGVRRGTIKRQFGIPPEAIVVTQVARIAEEKGQILLVDAAERLLKDYPHTYFLFVGTPTSKSYHEELMRRVHSCPHDEHILIVGFVDEVERVLADTDILALPSAEEGLPNAAIEAMAMECPVVAADVCSTNEAVEDGVTGYLMPNPVSGGSLADRLRLLLEDRECRRRMGWRGRRKVQEKFNLEKSIRRYEEVFLQARSLRESL